MFYVTKLDDAKASTPPIYDGHVKGYRQQPLIGNDIGSPHMTLTWNLLDGDGSIDPVLHSFEVSVYVFHGTLAVTALGSTTLLGPHHVMLLPVGTPYAARSVDGPVEFLQMSAPAALADGRRRDTYFTGETLTESAPVVPDMRDPRHRSAARFDTDAMDLGKLAVGSDVNAPTVSPSMATALLAYSGIGVKMLVDEQLGASLHTMFVVDYAPSAIAHPHDHPFEEAYVFVEGEVHALVDGELLILHAGDVLWAGVGTDHGFENRSQGRVRWIEVQAPQPPSRHSYRFSREWEHLEDLIGGVGNSPGAPQTPHH